METNQPVALSHSVCLFLGTWDSGSTMPGEPYIAKWPDEFGNLKRRSVLRPDCISKYFMKSNVIDVGNQLRQNELALEQHWQTMDPWFRIDTTVVGICVTDAYSAAKYQAPPSANISKMGVKNFAMHVVYDLWNRKVSKEPVSEILCGHPSNTRTSFSGQNAQLANQSTGPLAFGNIVELHPIRKTVQRGKGNDLVRRKCHAKAAGCHGQCNTECQHPVCMDKTVGVRNRFGSTKGTFVCMNQACQMKHWNEILGSLS